MGYRSDVVIAIHQSIMARALITDELPVFLKSEPSHQYDGATYWKIEGIKWYDSFADIQEMEKYFELLDEEPQVTNKEDPTFYFTVFGAIRLGEEYEDIQTWGDPRVYGIDLHQSLECPA